MLAGAVILGGIKSIGRFAGAVVPVMLLAYAAGALWVLFQNAGALPAAFGAIFDGAFSPPGGRWRGRRLHGWSGDAQWRVSRIHLQ